MPTRNCFSEKYSKHALLYVCGRSYNLRDQFHCPSADCLPYAGHRRGAVGRRPRKGNRRLSVNKCIYSHRSIYLWRECVYQKNWAFTEWPLSWREREREWVSESDRRRKTGQFRKVILSKKRKCEREEWSQPFIRWLAHGERLAEQVQGGDDSTIHEHCLGRLPLHLACIPLDLSLL